MVDLTRFLPGLSPVQGKAVVARFDGGRLSSEGGLLALREIERPARLGGPTGELPGGPAGAGEGRAPPGRDHPVSHADDRRRVRGRQPRRRAAPRPDVQAGAGSLAGGRGAVLAIDDLAAGKPPRPAGVAAPWAGARRAVLRLVPSGAEAHRPRYRRQPRFREGRLFDRVHGGQQLRLFNAYYDDYGFQPIVVFDAAGRFVTALLRPGKRPSGVEIRGLVRRLVGALRSHWPKVEILLRADSHYASPEVFDWCRKNRVDWVFGLAPNAALCRHVAALENSTATRFKAVTSIKLIVATDSGLAFI